MKYRRWFLRTTALAGIRYGGRSRHTWRRATKRYFHGPTSTRAQIKAKRKRGRRKYLKNRKGGRCYV